MRPRRRAAKETVETGTPREREPGDGKRKTLPGPPAGGSGRGGGAPDHRMVAPDDQDGARAAAGLLPFPLPVSRLPSPASPEAGFTLVALMVMLAILSIMLGVAVQTVTFQMQREKEAELIFRGNQYVEAVRLYKQKYGRFPMTLEEIWKAKPRVIRKKFKDPMTDSLNWGIDFLGQEGRKVGPGAGGRTPTPTPTPSTPPAGGVGFGRPGQRRGPIVGVHSTSCEESIKIYEGRRRYCEWKFVYKEKRQQTGAGRPPTGGQPPGSGAPPGNPPGGGGPPK